MISFNIEIADFVFGINTSFEDCKELCKDYITSEASDFDIEISNEDIAFEREKSDREAIYEGYVPQAFSDGYLETISVYRKIAEYINKHGSTVFHGALICKDGSGYLFTGRSGIGKTTHINNWLKAFPDCYIVNGDKPILKIDGETVIGYGTPWSGKECLNRNTSIKVKAIIELTRDSYNHIEEVSLKEMLPLLVGQTYRSSNSDGVKTALVMASEIGKRVKLYRLGCNMDLESAIVAFEGMNK